MTKESRHKEIIKLLETKKYFSVKELSEILFVSEPTIRRDLTDLDRTGYISRYYGGAKSLNIESEEIPIAFRQNYKQREKRMLASKAANLVNHGNVIFLDGSTSVIPIIEFLDNKKNITVITNSIHVVTLSLKYHFTVFCTGGILLKKSMIFFGEESFSNLKNFDIDLVFFSAKGVSLSGKVVDSSYEETVLRRRVIEVAKKSVFLFDSEKLGINAPYVVESIDRLDFLISDKNLPSDMKGLDSIKSGKTKFIIA